MEPGNLVLAPNWNWHDHNTQSNQVMIWFDGLDLPLVTSLEAMFFENHPHQLQPVEGTSVKKDWDWRPE